tara:strand:- start:1297 stop:1461 length:165 start_codon:yes stop_codon:yes gene_type:complete
MITPTSNKTLRFDLQTLAESEAYTNLILGLSRTGVTYGTANEGTVVIIEIYGGF